MASSASISAVERRDPARVMRLARLGSSHPSRLSFARILMRRLAGEGWRSTWRAWNLDDAGLGTAVFSVDGPARRYALVAVARPGASAQSEPGDDELAFVLVDGEATVDDVARLEAAVRAGGDGRLTARDLCCIRARRSTRLFEPVVDRLARGEQPDPRAVEQVGYVVRTVAVHASGKLGCADTDQVRERNEFAAPYQVEMLTMYLIRAFSHALVDHVAARRAPTTATTLSPERRRRLGVGNVTGPGLAPFFINHPVLTARWFAAREEALARVRGLERAEDETRRVFRARLADARDHVAGWRSPHPLQRDKIAALGRDLAALAERVARTELTERRPWEALWSWGEAHLSLEGQEMLASLLLEPHGELVDELAAEMAVDERLHGRLDGRMRVGELRAILDDTYDWALDIDFADPDAQAQLWYADAETGEARLASRARLGAAVEQPLAPARDAQELARALAAVPDDAPVAEFVLRFPAHRRAVRRAQIAQRHAYAEIRDNTLDADLLPLDLLRAKLAFMGATRFDPSSDRRVRVTLFQGAPLDDELGGADADGWIYATPPIADA